MNKKNNKEVTQKQLEAPTIKEIEELTEKALEVVDVSKDIELTETINPKDVYKLKNEVIMSADIPYEEKLNLLGQNQNELLENTEKALIIEDNARKRKIQRVVDAIKGFLGAFCIGLGGWILYKGNQNNNGNTPTTNDNSKDEPDDSDAA